MCGVHGYICVVHVGVYVCRHQLVVICCSSTAFAVGIFLLGYYVFQNPFPLGTASLGIPCFLFVFFQLGIITVPEKASLTEFILCCIPFVIWFLTLCVYISLTWANVYLVQCQEDHGIFSLCNMTRLGLRVSFAVVNVAAKQAVQMFWATSEDDKYHDDLSTLALLWSGSLHTQQIVFTLWIFPTIAGSWDLFVLMLLFQVVKVSVELLLYEYALNGKDRLMFFSEVVLDMVVPVIFVAMFFIVINSANAQYMYIYEEIDAAGGNFFGLIVLYTVATEVVSLLVVMKVMERSMGSEPFQALVANFHHLYVSDAFFPLTFLMMTSTILACGACMVLKHDGMDLSFQFTEWNGTWPFNL